jgi:hypothetical protein
MREINSITVEECAKAWKDFEIPGPRPHPCLFFDPAEIDEIRRLAQIEETRQYQEKQKILEVADVLLERDLGIARLGWLGESRWACAHCGTREVEIRRASPDAGRCLRCGHINDDTAFKSWWVAEMHGRSMHQLRVLTWAYLFTDAAAYAEKATGIMLEYAEWLPDCPILSEDRLRLSVDPQIDLRIGIQLTYSYDLLYNYPGWSDAQRAAFAEHVLRSTVQLNIERWPAFRLHNMYNTGCVLMAAVGLFLGEADYVDRAVNEQFGLIRALREGIDGDGFWPESSLNYHFAVVRDIASLTEAVYHAGFDFYQVDRYRQMYLGPLKLAEPSSGVIPGWGDSGNYAPDLFEAISAAYEIFYHRTSDPVVGTYLRASAARGRRSFGSLFITGDWKGEGEFQPSSALLDVQGLAVLNAGAGEQSKYVQLNYLRRIGGHNQEDRLNLLVYALNGFVGPKTTGADYFYPTYAWYRGAIGHNIVTLGGKGPDPGAGGDLAFYASFNQAQAISARADASYPGYKQQRTVVLVGDRYMVDLFRVAGDTPTHMDWIWHCLGELKRPAAAVPAAVEGEGPYRFIEDSVRLDTDEAWQATWTLAEPDKGIRAFSGADPYQDVIDWSAGSEDFIVRVKPDGHRVKVYNNITGYVLYPTPIMSPVFSSIYNYGAEFPRDPPQASAPVPRSGEPQTSQPCGYCTLTMAAQAGTEVFYARGPGYGWKIPEKMPLVVGRRRGSWTHFMTALDTYHKQPYVRSVRTLVDRPEAAAMQVTTGDSQETFIANYGDSPVEAEGLYCKGEFAAVSMRAGSVDWVMLVNGVHLVLGNFVLEAEQPGTFVAALNASAEWRAFTPAGEAVAVRVQPGSAER